MSSILAILALKLTNNGTVKSQILLADSKLVSNTLGTLKSVLWNTASEIPTFTEHLRISNASQYHGKFQPVYGFRLGCPKIF